MTALPAVSCPHCAVQNQGNSAFCQACGKALPAAVGSGPRILDGKEFATTSAGIKLQSDELQKEAKKAANALLTVAILQTIVPFILVAIVTAAPRASAAKLFNNMLFVAMFVVAGLFWGLYIWARFSPLPAAVAGLVLYVTLKAIDFIMLAVAITSTPSGQSSRSSSGPTPGFGGIWITILIIAMLVRAIQAGIKHRKLLRMQETGFPVVPIA